MQAVERPSFDRPDEPDDRESYIGRGFTAHQMYGAFANQLENMANLAEGGYPYAQGGELATLVRSYATLVEHPMIADLATRRVNETDFASGPQGEERMSMLLNNSLERARQYLDADPGAGNSPSGLIARIPINSSLRGDFRQELTNILAIEDDVEVRGVRGLHRTALKGVLVRYQNGAEEDGKRYSYVTLVREHEGETHTAYLSQFPGYPHAAPVQPPKLDRVPGAPVQVDENYSPTSAYWFGSPPTDSFARLKDGSRPERDAEDEARRHEQRRRATRYSATWPMDLWGAKWADPSHDTGVQRSLPRTVEHRREAREVRIDEPVGDFFLRYADEVKKRGWRGLVADELHAHFMALAGSRERSFAPDGDPQAEQVIRGTMDEALDLAIGFFMQQPGGRNTQMTQHLFTLESYGPGSEQVLFELQSALCAVDDPDAPPTSVLRMPSAIDPSISLNYRYTASTADAKANVRAWLERSIPGPNNFSRLR